MTRPRGRRRGPDRRAGPAGGTAPEVSPAGAAAHGALFVVGTPIGHLEDLSARAVATLRACRLVACEDTRVTRAILDRHGISTRVLSCHKFNEAEAAARVLEALEGGADVALVSDGGTPGLSDPGAVVVREAHRRGVRVVPIPGPSAATALWSVSGFSGPFTVVGFLPHRRGERRRALESLRDQTRPLILFESPHRILEMLEDAAAVLGDRDCCLGREMTKVHEAIHTGVLSAVRAAVAAGAVRGEFTVVVAGRPAAAPVEAGPGDLDRAAAAARRMVDDGVPRPEAARRAAHAAGVPRRAVYRRLLDRDDDAGGQREGRGEGAAPHGPDDDSEE